MANRPSGPPRRGGNKKFYFSRKKYCIFCKDRVQFIDYKNSKPLERFMMETGKIVPSRVSGVCPYHQKQLTKAIKRARHMGLLMFAESRRS